MALVGLHETFDGAPGHFDAWLLAPRLDVCGGFEVTRRLHVRGCAGIAGGGVHAQGYQYPSSKSTWVRWLAVANELGVAADLGRRWSLDASASLLLPVVRTSIVLRDFSGNVLMERDSATVGWISPWDRRFDSEGPRIRLFRALDGRDRKS